MPEPASRCALIVAERKSDWQRAVETLRDMGMEVVVLTQRLAEPPSTFAARVRARVSELAAGEVRLEQAVLCGGNQKGSHVLASRSLLVRAIASHMIQSGFGGKIAFRPHHSQRWSMEALATTVREMVCGTNVSIVLDSGATGSHTSVRPLSWVSPGLVAKIH